MRYKYDDSAKMNILFYIRPDYEDVCQYNEEQQSPSKFRCENKHQIRSQIEPCFF